MHGTGPDNGSTGNASPASQERLVKALVASGELGVAPEAVRILETHISRVLLAGEFTWKVKKPVDFGFLDFSTLEKRRRCCEEELRLNRRFAPGLYLEVVALTGPPDRPQVNGAGPVLEYAVKMRRFSQAGLLSSIADRHELSAAHVDEIVTLVAGMHAQAGRRPDDALAGTPEDVDHWVMENFGHIRRCVTDPAVQAPLDRLERWCGETFAALRPLIGRRREAGQVRECHGDLHLGNLALVDGRITPFDCIEFNPRLRWIDVMSEVAFLVMDLQERGYPRLAARFLNGYLQQGGDYAGLRLLPYYVVYRALVRAKVAALRLGQAGIDETGRAAARGEFAAYLDLAARQAAPRGRAIIVTCGVSGSGKTWWSSQLVERLDAVRVRSDVERKRLYGYAADADTGSAVGAGIYTAEAGRRTYARLAELAGQVIAAGYPVIVDATFLARAERERFRALAGELRVPAVLLYCEAPAEVLRERVHARDAAGGDASEAGLEVLASQQASLEPPGAEELAGWSVVTAAPGLPPEALAEPIRALLVVR